MTFNINSSTDWISWNPATHPTANFVNDVTFTAMPGAKAISGGSATVDVNGHIISFSNIVNPGNSLFNVNSTGVLTLNNAVINFNENSYGTTAALLVNTSDGSVTFNTVRIVNTVSWSVSSSATLCNVITGTLALTNIQMGSYAAPVKNIRLINRVNPDSTASISNSAFYINRTECINGMSVIDQAHDGSGITGDTVTLDSCVLTCINNGGTAPAGSSGFVFRGRCAFSNCYMYNESGGVSGFNFVYMHSFNTYVGENVNLFDTCYYYQNVSASGNVVVTSNTSAGTTLTATNFATNTVGFIPSGTFTTNYTNISTSHDYTQNTRVTPFTSASFQNTTYWTGANNPAVAGAPYLTKLSASPWDNSYTAFTDRPFLANPLPCLVKGTLIRVEDDGVVTDKPIETLKKGDKVVLGNRGTLGTIQEIFNTVVINPTSEQLPVKIPKDLLGRECPTRDLYLSERHLILPMDIKQGIDYEIHPVGFMKAPLSLEGVNKVEDWGNRVEYYHIVLEHPYDTLIANNMIVESYVK